VAYFKFTPLLGYIGHRVLPGKTYILKSVAFVELVHEATYEIRITISSSFRVKKVNQLIITSNKLTNSFVGLLTSDLRPYVHGPPV
jgi:hypothetical protein